jgi:poly-gamma-glutamate capsule biosynthesis protein CapA/YwtB (metallophosphatase superfamily)
MTDKNKNKPVRISYFVFCLFVFFFLILNNLCAQDSTISIVGVGDIMPGSNYPGTIYLPPDDDCISLFKPVLPFLREADVTFGNLEGCFLNEGNVYKKCNDSTNCYAFRIPDRYALCLAQAGFNLLGIANNHIYDFGPPGVLNTLKLLDSLKIHYSGLLSHPHSTFIKDSIRFGFCAFSPFTGTCDILDTLQAAQIVSELNDRCDIVILSMHAGGEGKGYEHVGKTMEIFLGEERGNTHHFAHKMIDAGADIIFGHGPHVSRAIELYNDRLICYSLGNFCTYARFNLRGANGVAPIINVTVDKDGRFLRGKITAVIQIGEGGPIPDPDRKAIKYIKQLTESDFPSANLLISDEGEIQKK